MIVIDTSALIAILNHEPERTAFYEAIAIQGQRFHGDRRAVLPLTWARKTKGTRKGAFQFIKTSRLKIQPPYAIVIHMTKPPNTTSILSVRVSPDERAILETAAEQAHTSLSDFMRRKALEAAEIEVLTRSIITIPAKDWEAFEAWVNQPAEVIPALTELARRGL